MRTRTRQYNHNLPDHYSPVTFTGVGREPVGLDGAWSPLNGPYHNIGPSKDPVPCSGQEIGGCGLSANSSGYHEVLTDDVSGVRNRKVLRLRNCEHTKVSWDMKPGRLNASFVSSGMHGIQGTVEGEFTPSGGLVAIASARIYPTANDRNFTRSNFMEGQYDGANLGEFFAELHNTVALFTSAAERLKTLTSLPELKRRVIVSKDWNLARVMMGDSSSFGKLRATVKTSAATSRRREVQRALALNDLSLAMAWGIAPFVQDVHNIWQSLQRLRDYTRRMKALQNRNIMVRSRTRHVGELETLSLGDTELSSAFSLSNFCERQQSWEHVVIGYYKVPDHYVDGVLSTLGTLLAGHGMATPFTTAWNTVRLSFVIDWFLPVGRALSGFRLDGPNAPALIGAIESTRATTVSTVESVVTRGNIPSSGHTPVLQIGQTSQMVVNSEHFVRTVIDDPIQTELPVFKTPTEFSKLRSLTQLLTSLVATRLRF